MKECMRCGVEDSSRTNQLQGGHQFRAEMDRARNGNQVFNLRHVMSGGALDRHPAAVKAKGSSTFAHFLSFEIGKS
ncbi:unnamed protein product [Dovyalis caffra]|uniref:Uncharacterized protein n=1 Tax=Dovyalis caffra TaxID=77055 RepID=A0AAV1RLE8_9ROSI|nr:unnamed protein product [Dovyalis caffra]